MPLPRRLRRRRGRRRPLGRAGARAGRAHALGVAGARGRAAVRRRRLPLRPAAVRAGSTLPSIAVIGTGKRVGKTAVDRPPRARCSRATATSSSSRWAAAVRAEPEVVETPPTVDDLLALSRSGRHAASDYLETAAVCGVPTIGCRRAGGGLAGQVFVSNVLEGARLAVERRPDVVVFDGERRRDPAGRGRPPRARRRRGRHDARRLLQHLPAPHLRPRRRRRLPSRRRRSRRDAPPPPARAARRPRRRLHRRRRGRRRTSTRTSSTSRATSPTAPRSRASWRRLDADTYLVELKAAAIDVVAEDALARGRQVVLAANDVVAPGLDEALLALAPVPA